MYISHKIFLEDIVVGIIMAIGVFALFYATYKDLKKK